MSSTSKFSRRLCMVLDVVVLLSLATFVVYMLMQTPRTNYDPDRMIYPIKGIDVSAHNGVIDFNKVAADSVSFVLIKATEGTDFCDAQFNVNYHAAHDAGLKVGAYHFFRFDSPGDVQARHFLAAVDGKVLELPLTVDVEKWGNVHNYDEDDVRTNLRLMLNTLASAGYPLMLYTNKHGYNAFVKDDFDDQQLWICSLSTPPIMSTWKLWQHSHGGKVDGIDGLVDVNTFNSPLCDFDTWCMPYQVAITNCQ